MALPDRPRLVIGLTGPFGSGCTSAAKLMTELTPSFHYVGLSDWLKKEWREREGKPRRSPTRHELQRLGDEVRKTSRGFLVEKALDHVGGLAKNVNYLVVDGIRNTGEIDYLQQRFGERFYLFAIHARADERWKRVKRTYQRRGEGENDFVADDNRDRDEETPEGQQVEKCVDRADILLLNEEDLSETAIEERFKSELGEYVELVLGKTWRYPTRDEVLMNLAFSAAHASKCLKRNVGAVIATERGEPISNGFNENPDAILPCVDQWGECYRDIIRNEHFAKLAEGHTVCPKCGHAIGPVEGPPWRCPCRVRAEGCDCNVNLEPFFFPDRAMKWCTALHAEERAIINAFGRDLRGTSLYTTAYPCFLCTEKILQAGVSRVVFADPYPDPNSADLFDEANPEVELERFAGVRSGRFDQIFGKVRP